MLDDTEKRLILAKERTKQLVESGIPHGLCHAHVLAALTGRTDFSPANSKADQLHLEKSLGVVRSSVKFSIEAIAPNLDVYDAVLVGGMITMPDGVNFSPHVVAVIKDQSGELIVVDAMHKQGFSVFPDQESLLKYIKRHRKFWDYNLQTIGIQISSQSNT